MPYLTTAVLAAALVACSGGGGGGSGGGAAQAAQQAVRASIEAENASDAAAFLALWTDDALRSYDAGSRADIGSGQAPLGGEKADLRSFEATAVRGRKATTTAVVAVDLGLYRMRFDLDRRGDGWVISGWQFLGPAPPVEGTPVAQVRAVDYGFDVDVAPLATGSFGVNFANAGEEAHEISVLALPPGTTKAEAVLALGSVRGPDFAGLPAGYSAAGHLAYADRGQSGTYSLARTLEPGTYALACFLPAGGVDPSGRAKEAGAPNHVSRGMLTVFAVG